MSLRVRVTVAVATAVAVAVGSTGCSAVVSSTARPVSSPTATSSSSVTPAGAEKRWFGAVVAMETKNHGVRSATCSFLDGASFTDSELGGLREELRNLMVPELDKDPKKTNFDGRSGDSKVREGKLNFYCHVDSLMTPTT